MCVDPATMIAGISKAAAAIGSSLGGLSTAVSIGGGVLSAYGQMQNAKAQERANLRTAALQDQAALDAIEQGNQESDRRRRAGAAIAAENKVGMAANGVDVSGAHALDLLDDQQALIAEDAFTIRANSRKQAGQYSQQASNSRADAASAKSQAIFAPVKTLLGTASKVGSKYAYMASNKEYA